MVSRVKELLASTKNIVVVGHKNPDGDAVGSCMGLCGFLAGRGHGATVVLPNDFPSFLKWMPGSENITIFEKETEKATALLNGADIIFTLDFNQLSRAGAMELPLKNSNAALVMIDHHQAPAAYATATYSDTAMSSTCEMVYHFINSFDNPRIDQAMATNLYTGIMTDTGSFRYPSTSPTTHRAAAHLMELGANSAQIHENVYDNSSPDRIKLLEVALQNLAILPQYRTAYITLSQSELDENNFKKGDTEGFVNYALSVRGIVFAVIFIENKKEGIVKMSLRSKGGFSVNTFARNHYNGGGHTNAA
ncbi:MAG: DHH family phosphoesterase, partial [Marinirhabdus sp.]